MSFNPKKRYSAVAVFSDDLERVVLIHKLRPDWQAGKANLPGGKVEASDWQCEYSGGQASPPCTCSGKTWNTDHRDEQPEPMAYLRCAVRELHEETGLDIAAAALKLFCRLRFISREGDAAECYFFAARGDVDAARTLEEERVFVESVDCVLSGYANNGKDAKVEGSWWMPLVPNLPYIVAMVRQCLRGEGGAAWPLTVYESGATPC